MIDNDHCESESQSSHRSIINLRIVREVVEGVMGHSACLIEPELKRYSLKLKN